MPAPLYNLIPFYPFPTHQQGVPCLAVGLHAEHQPQGIQIHLEFPQLGHDLRQLHSRTVVRWAGSWFGLCTCGFVTTGCLSEDAARTEPCEVESILAVSAERKARLFAGNR